MLDYPAMTLGYDDTDQPKGIIDLRPMDVGDVLDGTIRVYRARPWVFIGIMAVIAGIPLLIQQSTARYFTVILGDIIQLISAEDANPDMLEAFTSQEFIVATAIFFFAGILMFFFAPLAQAAMIHAVSETILGRESDIGTSIRAILSRVGSIILAYFLLGLIMLTAYIPIVLLVMLGTFGDNPLLVLLILIPVMFVVLFVLMYVYIKFLFIPHAIVLDGTSAIDAFRRSFNLTGGYWWRTFGIFMLISIIIGIIANLLGQGIALAEMGLRFALGLNEIIIVAIGGTLMTVLSLIIQPITIIATTLLYYDLRIRKEGFDLLLLASALATDDQDASDAYSQVPMG